MGEIESGGGIAHLLQIDDDGAAIRLQDVIAGMGVEGNQAECGISGGCGILLCG